MASNIIVTYIKRHPLAKAPQNKYHTDAGFDCFSVERVVIEPKKSAVVNLGISLLFPKGFRLVLRPRSSHVFKHDVITYPGLIDYGYTGTLHIKLFNLGEHPYTVEVGEKICQFVVTEVPTVLLEEGKFIPSTERGENGFGSSGR